MKHKLYYSYHSKDFILGNLLYLDLLALLDYIVSSIMILRNNILSLLHLVMLRMNMSLLICILLLICQECSLMDILAFDMF